MKLADRLLTIAVTVTLTSAVWILIGSFYLEDTDANDTAVTDGQPAVSPGDGSTIAAADPAPLETVPRLENGSAASLVVPVLGVRPDQLSDTFSDGRAGGERLHEAIDIMAPAGAPVIAAAPGTVESLFQSEAGGKTVYIRSEDGRTIHYYAHLAAYEPGLQESQTVRRAERLGTVGSSGNASEEAPHLHFAILRTTPDAAWWEPATAINPYPLLVGR